MSMCTIKTSPGPIEVLSRGPWQSTSSNVFHDFRWMRFLAISHRVLHSVLVKPISRARRTHKRPRRSDWRDDIVTMTGLTRKQNDRDMSVFCTGRTCRKHIQTSLVVLFRQHFWLAYYVARSHQTEYAFCSWRLCTVIAQHSAVRVDVSASDFTTSWAPHESL